ncbi:protein kinase domain [Coleofasciculus chthonoplastes PCC 7420]|uniref:Protein kinase domain n=1 Tax=Coleofasciculus chthonoplastes PCC 7420 TaxID=118168 RepID=B4VLX1_9CYAN|nr:protein kinase domain [Coleofasciculus chthonoplastes PCC 7420]
MPNEYLKHDPDYEKYVDRFIKEGQRLARLSSKPHPHIVRVRDSFKDEDNHCLVMDFVPGENLFQVVKRLGAIPEAQAVECIRQVGEALIVVHQARLVHRDAHPGNIILHSNGNAVLIDFGIAKELFPSTQSSTGNAGNWGFAPYEQIHLGSREPNVDVYCLAATLYYAVTGQRPTKSLDRRLYNTLLIPPQHIISGISDHVNQAILKGMELEAKNRPQSMQAWLKLLEVTKVVIPSFDAPVYGRNFVNRSTHNNSGKRFRTVISGKAKTLPWVRLVVISGGYLLMGILLVLTEAGFVSLVVAGIVSGIVAWTVAKDVVWNMSVVGGAVAGAVYVAMVLALNLAGDRTGFIAVALALACAGVMVLPMAGKKLQESFSKFHTFLILLGTSWLGLGLGWLLGSIFR